MIEVGRFGPVTRFKLARKVLGRPPYWTAAYFVDGLLVDTGCHFAMPELSRALKRQQVHTIVNTHHHEDHIGANARISREHGAAIWAHPLALPFLRDPRRIQMHLYRRIFWGLPLPSEGREIAAEVSTDRYRFQVIHVGGHSPDHIVLYEPREGWIFSGDIFIGGKDRAMRPDYNVAEIIAALERMAALPLSWLFPGSGSVRENPGDEIAAKAAQMQELRTEIRTLHQRGMSEKQIARTLLGRDGFIRYISGGHFSAANLVRAYLREP